MRIGGLDLNLLIALDVLLEEKSVSRAARRLHLTQSTVSAVLKRLRLYFNDELLVPAGRRMIRSPAAEQLVQPVGNILSQARSLTALVSGFDAGSSIRRFRVMLTDYVSHVLMVRVLELVRQEAPGITIELMQPSINPVKALAADAVDLLIWPGGMRSRAHCCESVLSDGYSSIVWSGNRTAAQQLDLVQFASMRHAICRFGVSRSSYFDQYFATNHDVVRHVDVIAPSFELLPHLVVNTDRIATLPMRLATAYAQQLPLRVVTLSFDVPQLQIVAQWNAFRDQDPGLQWLRALIRRVAAALPGPIATLQ